jgi:hypothetical protein
MKLIRKMNVAKKEKAMKLSQAEKRKLATQISHIRKR